MEFLLELQAGVLAACEVLRDVCGYGLDEV